MNFRRKLGAVLTGLFVIMTLFGVNYDGIQGKFWPMFYYWGVVVILLIAIVVIVSIDIMAIRVQYLAGRRDSFKQSLADPTFIQKLHKAELEKKGAGSKEASKRRKNLY